MSVVCIDMWCAHVRMYVLDLPSDSRIQENAEEVPKSKSLVKTGDEVQCNYSCCGYHWIMNGVQRLKLEALGLIPGGCLILFSFSQLTSLCLQNWMMSMSALVQVAAITGCLLYTSPSPRDATLSRMPSSA